MSIIAGRIRTFPVLINLKNTIEELVEGCNLEIGYKRDMLNSEYFPPYLPKHRQVRFLQEKNVFLLEFSKPTGTRFVLSQMDKMNFRFGDVFDLLALNRTYPASPGMKKKFSLEGLNIVSLGNSVRDEYWSEVFLVPVLECMGAFKNRTLLFLNATEFYDIVRGRAVETDDWWPKGTSFIAVLK